MSHENVEIVRRYIASVDALRGQVDDPVGLAALELPEFSSHMEEYWHPEVVFDVSGRPDGGIYRGRDGVIQATRDWLQAWEEYEMEFKQVIPGVDPVVLVQIDVRGRPRGGPKVEVRDLYIALTVRDGQFVRYKEYVTRAMAVEAAGISE